MSENLYHVVLTPKLLHKVLAVGWTQIYLRQTCHRSGQSSTHNDTQKEFVFPGRFQYALRCSRCKDGTLGRGNVTDYEVLFVDQSGEVHSAGRHAMQEPGSGSTYTGWILLTTDEVNRIDGAKVDVPSVRAQTNNEVSAPLAFELDLDICQPYRWVPRLLSVWPLDKKQQQKISYGTAFRVQTPIEQREVEVYLTAGHNLWDIVEGKYIDLAAFYPFDYDEQKFSERIVSTLDSGYIYVHPDWREHSNTGYDFGIVVVPRDTTQDVGIDGFPLRKLSDEETLNRNVEICGYPGEYSELPPDTKIFLSAGHVTGVEENSIEYNLETARGSSGSPIYTTDETKNPRMWQVIGIHNWVDDEPKGVRMRDEITNLVATALLSWGRGYKIVRAVGGTGGSAFNDTGSLSFQSQVEKIEIHTGKRVDKIVLHYTNGTVLAHGKGDTPAVTKTLSADEYITEIQVYVDEKDGTDRIFYIAFYTNKSGDEPLISGGHKSGTKHHLDPNDGDRSSSDAWQVVGFLGRSGVGVDSLGVIAVPVWDSWL